MPPFKKVARGQTLSIPADDYNACIATAKAYHQGLGGAPSPPQRPTGNSPSRLFVKNVSSTDAPRFAVLGIESVVFTPSDNLDEFQNAPTLTVTTPTTDDHTGNFVIAQEPIPAGQIGLAVLQGLTACQINITDEDHTHADVTNEDNTQLTSGSSGAARILHVNGTGTQWALVALGTSQPIADYGQLYMTSAWSHTGSGEETIGWNADGSSSDGVTPDQANNKLTIVTPGTYFLTFDMDVGGYTASATPAAFSVTLYEGEQSRPWMACFCHLLYIQSVAVSQRIGANCVRAFAADTDLTLRATASVACSANNGQFSAIRLN